MVDLIAMKHSPAAASLSCDAIGEHVNHRLEIGARQVPIRVSGADTIIQFVFVPAFRGAGRDNLLSQNIQRIPWNLQFF